MGAQGPTGSKGDTDAQGPTGSKGDTDAQGPTNVSTLSLLRKFVAYTILIN